MQQIFNVFKQKENSSDQVKLRRANGAPIVPFHLISGFNTKSLTVTLPSYHLESSLDSSIGLFA